MQYTILYLIHTHIVLTTTDSHTYSTYYGRPDDLAVFKYCARACVMQKSVAIREEAVNKK